MSKTAFIKSYPKEDSVIIFNSKGAYDFGINKKKRAYVSFGSLKNFVDVEINDQLPEGDILLSQNIIEAIHLPDYPRYEVCIKDNEIVIGPYIGMLVSSENSKITSSFLDRMMIFTDIYEKLNGALVVFALDKVDTKKGLIDGYCYNPSKNCWQRGTFPYPSAIYRTIGLSDSWQNHFLSVLGNKFFNNCYFNKWDTYKWFSTDPEIRHYLPYTVLYRSARDVTDMLDKYGNIFIKPVSGLAGHGVVKASYENKSVVFRYREDGVNNLVIVNKPDEISSFIESRFRPRKYLVQQSINLLKYNGSVMDFRCAVQKDQSNRWICNAIFGKCGEKGSVVSNISSGGTPYKCTDLLKMAIPYSDRDISAIEKRMKLFALKVCDTLDEFGINCGTLGLDIGIDADKRIWLIEINNRDPSPAYALDIDDKLLYCTIKTSPLLYAKSLAGFDV